ncbi:hypothetical protein EFN13_22 [Enterococcus phage N13]|nr:hypothetical protein EFN13_22 [Enterococcus phage N13]
MNFFKPGDVGSFSEEWEIQSRYFTDKESMYKYMEHKSRVLLGYWEENGIIWTTYKLVEMEGETK